MSYEYLAKAALNTPVAPVALRRLVDSPEVFSLAEFLSISGDSIQLRWRGLPPRQDWPEDITISSSTNGLLVSFHSGAAHLREEFLLSITKACSNSGVSVTAFEEM